MADAARGLKEGCGHHEQLRRERINAENGFEDDKNEWGNYVGDEEYEFPLEDKQKQSVAQDLAAKEEMLTQSLEDSERKLTSSEQRVHELQRQLDNAQSEKEQLAIRFQDTESSLQAVRTEMIAKEGDMQSDLDTARKDKAALMEDIEQLTAELAATQEEVQAVQAGLQVLLNTWLTGCRTAQCAQCSSVLPVAMLGQFSARSGGDKAHMCQVRLFAVEDPCFPKYRRAPKFVFDPILRFFLTASPNGSAVCAVRISLATCHIRRDFRFPSEW